MYELSMTVETPPKWSSSMIAAVLVSVSDSDNTEVLGALNAVELCAKCVDDAGQYFISL